MGCARPLCHVEPLPALAYALLPVRGQYALPDVAAVALRGIVGERRGGDVLDGLPQCRLVRRVEAAIAAMCLVTAIGGFATGIGVGIGAGGVIVAEDRDIVAVHACPLPVRQHIGVHLGDDRHAAAGDVAYHPAVEIGLVRRLFLRVVPDDHVEVV